MLYKYDSLVHELLYAARSLLTAQGIVSGDPALILRGDPVESERGCIHDARAHLDNVVIALHRRHGDLTLHKQQQQQQAYRKAAKSNRSRR